MNFGDLVTSTDLMLKNMVGVYLGEAATDRHVVWNDGWECISRVPAYTLQAVSRASQETPTPNRKVLGVYGNMRNIGIVPFEDHRFRHLVGQEVEVLESTPIGLSYCRHGEGTFFWPTIALWDVKLNAPKPPEVKVGSWVRLKAYSDEEAARSGALRMSFTLYSGRFKSSLVGCCGTVSEVCSYASVRVDGEHVSWPLSALEVVG